MSSPTASTASLIPKEQKDAAPSKDYAAALAGLQSMYGAGGQAPVVPGHGTPRPEGSKKAAKEGAIKTDVGPSATTVASKGTKTPQGEVTPQTTASTTKDYESALASLQSSYGFGGSAPIVPRR